MRDVEGVSEKIHPPFADFFPSFPGFSRPHSFRSMFAPFCVVVLTVVAAVAHAKKPNLVFALVDDLGWNGVGKCRRIQTLTLVPRE